MSAIPPLSSLAGDKIGTLVQSPVEHPYGERRRRLVEQLQGLKLPALAVSHLPNVRYLTGFTGSNALLLVSGRDCVLLTDPRYDLQARDECDCKVQVVSGALWTAALKLIQRRRIRVLAFESERVSCADWRRLSAAAESLKVKPLDGVVERLRAVKDPAEIDAIQRSVAVCARAYERTLKSIKPGLRERDVAAELDYQMRRLGADGPAFETIVAAGAHSALPHARPGSQPLGNDQLLLIDMGASLDGYASDMTRVVHLGKPGRTARKMHKAVLEAQLAALDAVRPGIPVLMVDQAARKVLRGHGLDASFTHSTGHGLGLEIHEGPRVGKGVETMLEAGMVITIEPGVYLQGEGGVRIEDTVLVTPSGRQVLTPVSKELTVL
jgi:Xaa-Pro aminopeptidase